MAKRTAIIDIGSNSARLVIFEKSSRFGFHLICEQKSKVRIGEGAYSKGGYLQPIGIERAYLALNSFVQTIKKYHVKKVISVATSALRDAPNGREFVRWIRQELNLSIKIIDGNEEAKLGAIAATNLLPIYDAITIDIGGGSSDIALIHNGIIAQTYSLDIGTVRIKELFFDGDSSSDSIEKARKYIANELKKLPSNFRAKVAVGIGGTARTISKGVLKRHNYPLNKLHAFEYKVQKELLYFNDIICANNSTLHNLYIKKGRFDTIKEGTLIFEEILKTIEAKNVITSSVGVREGVFLKDLLRSSQYKFPQELNPSLKSILDRFDDLTSKDSHSSHRIAIASSLYDIFHQEFLLSTKYKRELYTALKLSNIGKTLRIYDAKKHAFYISMQELNFGFTHKEMVLISLLLRMDGNSLLHKPLVTEYKPLLPKKEELKFLSFLYTLSMLLHDNSNSANITFTYANNTLSIHSDQSLYHAKENIALLERPYPFDIIFEDKKSIPNYTF